MTTPLVSRKHQQVGGGGRLGPGCVLLVQDRFRLAGVAASEDREGMLGRWTITPDSEGDQPASARFTPTKPLDRQRSRDTCPAASAAEQPGLRAYRSAGTEPLETCNKAARRAFS